ncbi:hypothetical protein [Bradyrhizobium sp. HKCCYLS20291]|uniref:hypothetical protein n=1 Tax=Bradyrhizobium sp. HKCCYLS20291 TaxID=3420766 RepID=UPI003EBDA6E7
MPSATYDLIVQAMITRQQVLCMYRGFARAVCPIILGHTAGRERVLAFQFAVARATACRPAAVGNASKLPR